MPRISSKFSPKASSIAARNRMKANKSSYTAPEGSLRYELRKLRLSFSNNRKLIFNVNRTVDIVFTKSKVAVLVDGCFWHGCPTHGTWPKQNAEFWKKKIETNIERDKNTNILLRKNGWKVIRIWEHEDPQKAAQKIFRVIQTRISK